MQVDEGGPVPGAGVAAVKVRGLTRWTVLGSALPGIVGLVSAPLLPGCSPLAPLERFGALTPTRTIMTHMSLMLHA